VPYVTTSDGVRLHYTDTGGGGQPLLMLHGWSLSGAVFKHQVAGLSDMYRVLTLDCRGHGESERPRRGYRAARLAKDLQDALISLDLNDVALLGWSMGCCVAWSYWDLFGAERLKTLILVDEAPWLLPSYSIYEDQPYTLDCAMLDRLYMGLIGPEADQLTAGFLRMMHTAAFPVHESEWLLSEALKMPRDLAALLLLDQICTDWRDTIETITLPTLVIAGRASLIKWKTQVWIAEHIPGARLEIFEEDEGGSHVMFLENPGKFNGLVREHIG